MLYNTLNNKSNGAVFLTIDLIIDKEHTLSIFLQKSILQKWLGVKPKHFWQSKKQRNKKRKNEIKSLKKRKIIFLAFFKKYDNKKGVFMAKSKSLGYQIHSALAEINLQDKDKRTDIFNKENDTNYKNVGKREFKRNGTSINYIFSKRSAENIAEKSKTFTKFLQETYNVKMVRDIKPEMCIAFLDSKKGCSTKTISAYKNALEKISIACEKKFHIL